MTPPPPSSPGLLPLLPLSFTIFVFFELKYHHVFRYFCLTSASSFSYLFLLILCLVLPPPPDRVIRPGSQLTSVHRSAGCSAEGRQRQQQRPSVVYVEHVVVRVTVAHSRRGDLSIALTSPQGTVSQLLANR